MHRKNGVLPNPQNIVVLLHLFSIYLPSYDILRESCFNFFQILFCTFEVKKTVKGLVLCINNVAGVNLIFGWCLGA